MYDCTRPLLPHTGVERGLCLEEIRLKLEIYGWNSHFASHFEPFAQEGFSVGRVYLETKKGYWLQTPFGETHAEISGKLRFEAWERQDLPAVGDWVVIQYRPGHKAIIQNVLPRTSKFSRKVVGNKTEEQVVAANVDVIFLVTGLDNDFNLRRIERYLIMAWESGARPVVLLNKADLCAELEARRAEVESVALGVPILPLSAKFNEGLDHLQPFLKAGETVSLLGSSGVGKSSIVNRLLGTERQKTNEVRASDDRGKHTTTNRELIVTPSGAIVIDTPGMRELQLWVGDQGISETFEDIEAFARDCYFTDCKHQSEPGCAIRQALADASLDQARYDNYLEMKQELDYVTRRQDKRAQLVEKQRWKKIHQNQKQHYKLRNK
ncbi:MAG: ribosome small subunit-dependent GTPase A [Blastocatellia bacterium]|nr:ribosome small subunit-dependent GTPase A [Blastocatellia bacterium]